MPVKHTSYIPFLQICIGISFGLCRREIPTELKACGIYDSGLYDTTFFEENFLFQRFAVSPEFSWLS